MMLEIEKNVQGNTLNISLEGRLDTITARELEGVISGYMIGDVDSMILDLEKLEYISSAGLRILLISRKLTDSLGGELTVRNIRPEILDILKMTGFTDFLEIEQE